MGRRNRLQTTTLLIRSRRLAFDSVSARRRDEEKAPGQGADVSHSAQGFGQWGSKTPAARRRWTHMFTNHSNTQQSTLFPNLPFLLPPHHHYNQQSNLQSPPQLPIITPTPHTPTLIPSSLTAFMNRTTITILPFVKFSPSANPISQPQPPTLPHQNPNPNPPIHHHIPHPHPPPPPPIPPPTHNHPTPPHPPHHTQKETIKYTPHYHPSQPLKKYKKTSHNQHQTKPKKRNPHGGEHIRVCSAVQLDRARNRVATTSRGEELEIPATTSPTSARCSRPRRHPDGRTPVVAQGEDEPVLGREGPLPHGRGNVVPPGP